jgi:hypothetical protein
MKSPGDYLDSPRAGLNNRAYTHNIFEVVFANDGS